MCLLVLSSVFSACYTLLQPGLLLDDVGILVVCRYLYSLSMFSWCSLDAYQLVYPPTDFLKSHLMY